jgi:membrane protease YdiL (CAAX protease family)
MARRDGGAGRPPPPGLRSAVAVVAWVFLLSVPFWVVSGFTTVTLPAQLPLSAVMVVVPLGVAVAFAGREQGSRGVGRLLRCLLDPRGVRPRSWFWPALLSMPAATLVAYGVMRWTGRPLPPPEISAVTVVAAVAVFLVAAAAEEAVWTCRVTDPLQRRWGTVTAGLLVGGAWALWHLPGYLEVRSPAWTAWQCVVTIAARVLIVWMYERSGRSGLTAVLLHASSNVAYVAFPIAGSHYDPAYLAPVLVLAALVAAATTVAQGEASHSSQWYADRSGSGPTP